MADKTWWGFDPGNEEDWGTAGNWNPSGVPTNSDRVWIGPGSSDISGTLGQGGVTLGTVVIEPGYTGNIGFSTGSTPSYLELDCDSLITSGTGIMYIDLSHSGAINVLVEDARTNLPIGQCGLYLTTDGSGTIGNLSVNRGKVALGYFGDDPAQTVAECIVSGPDASLVVGDPVTQTAVTVEDGVYRSNSSATITTFTISGGLAVLLGSSAVTTANCEGGTTLLGGSGTVATCNIDGGVVDATYLAQAQTITALNFLEGSLISNASYITISTLNDRSDNVAFEMVVRKKVTT